MIAVEGDAYARKVSADPKQFRALFEHYFS